MTTRTKFEVSYAGKIARFSDRIDAMFFAQRQSVGSEGLVEVRDAAGLIGQFCSGHTTLELQPHWHAALGIAPRVAA
jgi:hypothetical protein